VVPTHLLHRTAVNDLDCGIIISVVAAGEGGRLAKWVRMEVREILWEMCDESKRGR
jgi:siroheme synthase (precorrin-2 oxidase/ferrochelatase)